MASCALPLLMPLQVHITSSVPTPQQAGKPHVLHPRLHMMPMRLPMVRVSFGPLLRALAAVKIPQLSAPRNLLHLGGVDAARL